MVNDNLGNRMKEFYENVPKTRLVRRMPVAIRIDGKAFHTFTRGFDKPFDKVLIKSMQNTMKYLCENIQGCVLGYHQSDEITLILIDYTHLNSDAWFNYEVQKMCSISASMATMAFNRYFKEEMDNWWETAHNGVNWDSPEWEKIDELLETYANAYKKGAMFDARCFNIPREEVTNLIYWRQLDATRNSIQMVGQANFSHKELQNKTCNMIQDMLFEEKGINWNNFPAYLKRGSCCLKNHDFDEYGVDWGEGWRIDENIPIFKEEGREYIEKRILSKEE